LFGDVLVGVTVIVCLNTGPNMEIPATVPKIQIFFYCVRNIV
jgi:hypothetical protein